MSICGTPSINNPIPTKESIFRAELAKLALPDRIRRIDYRLAQTSFALAARNEKLLALRGDFDSLTLDFWRGFARCLGCENPERTIADQKKRMRSVGHLSIILLVIAITVLAGVAYSLSRKGHFCKWHARNRQNSTSTSSAFSRANKAHQARAKAPRLSVEQVFGQAADRPSPVQAATLTAYGW